MGAKKIVKDSIKILLMGIVAFILLVISVNFLGSLLGEAIDSSGGYGTSCCPDYIDDNFGTRLNFRDGVYKLKKDECGFLDGTCKVVVSFESRPQEALDTVKKMKNYWNVSYGDIYIHSETEADDSFYRVVYDPDKSELKYTSETR